MIALETLLAIKLVYTAFMAVLIPVYLYRYGPTNFLYFCDLALLFTLAGLWLESPLLISMCAVGLLVPQALWVGDFVFNLFGLRTTGPDRLHVRAGIARCSCAGCRCFTAGCRFFWSIWSGRWAMTAAP